MPIFLRHTGLGSTEDYSVIYRQNGAPEIEVGRIFLANKGSYNSSPWFWSVDFHKRKGRTPPHQGRAKDFQIAKAAWRRCWDSAKPSINPPPGVKVASPIV